MFWWAPCAHALRWKIVCERFELPMDFGGVLRYEDCDGDLISVSTDEEVAEALRLCGDGKTLKMTLSAATVTPVAAAAETRDDSSSPKVWAGALSDNHKAAGAVLGPTSPAPSQRERSESSASGDFELVDGTDSRPASVRSGGAGAAAAEEGVYGGEPRASVPPVDEEEEDEVRMRAKTPSGRASASIAAVLRFASLHCCACTRTRLRVRTKTFVFAPPGQLCVHACFATCLFVLCLLPHTFSSGAYVHLCRLSDRKAVSFLTRNALPPPLFPL